MLHELGLPTHNASAHTLEGARWEPRLPFCHLFWYMTALALTSARQLCLLSVSDRRLGLPAWVSSRCWCGAPEIPPEITSKDKGGKVPSDFQLLRGPASDQCHLIPPVVRVLHSGQSKPLTSEWPGTRQAGTGQQRIGKERWRGEERSSPGKGR